MSAMRRRRGLTAGLVLVASSVTAPLWAQSHEPEGGRELVEADVDAARAHFQEAVEFAKQGRWAEARRRYERSLELKDDPITRYSLAVVQAELGELTEARQGLRTYLQRTESLPPDEPKAEYRPAAADAIRSLDQRIARLRVTVTPPTADSTVLVDGKSIDRWPMDLDPGSHWVEVVAPGHQRVTESLQLSEGQRKNVSLQLLQLERSPLAPRVAAAPKSATTELASDDGGGSSTGPIILMVAGGATSLVGLGVGLGAVGRASSHHEDDPQMGGIRAQAVAGDVLAIVGATAAAGGLVWWLTGDDDEQAQDAALSVAPGGASLQVRF